MTRMTQQVAANLDTIASGLRYRRERLGHWEPVVLAFNMEVRKPLLAVVHDDVPLGEYQYTEVVGPNIERIGHPSVWAERNNQSCLPSFNALVEEAQRQVDSHQRWRWARLTGPGGMQVEVKQTEASDDDLLMLVGTTTFLRQAGDWTSEAPVTNTVHQLLANTAKTVSRLESQLDHDITERAKPRS